MTVSAGEMRVSGPSHQNCQTREYQSLKTSTIIFINAYIRFGKIRKLKFISCLYVIEGASYVRRGGGGTNMYLLDYFKIRYKCETNFSYF